MMGTTSIQETFAGWFAHIAARAQPAHRHTAACVLDAEELGRFHQSLHATYREFARLHPEWALRGFDERFLREEAAPLLMMAWSQGSGVHCGPSGMDLARAWERKYGVLLCGAARVTQVTRLAGAATVLLMLLVSSRDRR